MDKQRAQEADDRQAQIASRLDELEAEIDELMAISVSIFARGAPPHTTTTQKRRAKLRSLRGLSEATTPALNISHYDLARRIEDLGYEISEDPDDNYRSAVFDDSERIANIFGDEVAVLTIDGDAEEGGDEEQRFS